MSRQTDAPLTQLNTFKLPSVARELWLATKRSQLQAAINASHHRHPVILAGGSNILLPEHPLELVWQLRDDLLPIEPDSQGRVSVWAGTSLSRLINSTIAHGWPGGENFVLIPGSVGAAVYNNIHGYSNDFIGRYVTGVDAWDFQDRTWVHLDHDQLQFGYDTSLFHSGRYLIAQVDLQFKNQVPSGLLRARYGNYARQKCVSQPYGVPSAGCFWANPTNSAQLCARFPQFASKKQFPAGF